MNNIRAHFPILNRTMQKMPLCYLDSASTSQKPQAVIDAIVHTYTTFNANPGRAIYELAEQATQQYEDARRTVAQFINADPREVIFVNGTTEGINTIAHGWAMNHLKSGDEIVLSELEHHANLVPWQKVALKTGAVLQFIPITKDGSLDYTALPSIITKKAKLVAITHSSNALGTSVDLVPIIHAAKKVGAAILVDAAQSAPHQKIDVTALSVDFLTFSGHKMLGPTGSGVLYIHASRLSQVEPLTYGGGAVFEVDWQQATLREAPAKFEAGTVLLAQAVGLAAAINFLKEHVPFDALQKHEAALCARLIDGLSKHKNIKILGSINQLRTKGHLVTFTIEGIHAHDVAAYLDQQGICVRAGHFCAQPLMNKLGFGTAIRASFYCYSTFEDVDRLLEAIKQLL